MTYIKQFFRIIYINYVLAKYGLDEIVLTTPIFKPLKFLMYLSPFAWTRNKNISRGQRIRQAIEELGPIFIKFGQIISTRLDILPADIAVELVKLQDKVPPFDGNFSVKVIEKAIGKNINEIFQEFSLTPLASASIAQVHAATLKDGKEVVVKILRPKIKQQIAQDIILFEMLARLATKYSAVAKKLKVTDVVAEFKKCIFDELDLMREAANASQLRRNFLNSDLLYVPEIHWELTKNNILVMERIYGLPISNIEELKAKKVDLKKLAETGVQIFFTQVFKDCFFHADMHPGNVWVAIDSPNNPKYLALDFGIVGTLSVEDQRYLAENALAFLNRDYRTVAKLHIESGWIPKTTRLDEFESAIRTVCEPMFARQLKDISFGQTLMRLFQTARRFDMHIQPQLILLQKTLISVEGFGRQLYPDLDLWTTAKPFLQDWMKRQVGVKALLRKVKSYRPYWLEQIPELPNTLLRLLNQPNSFNLATNAEDTKVEQRKYIKSDHTITLIAGFALGILSTIGLLFVLK